MKKSVYFLLLLAAISCQKNKDNDSVLLREISADYGSNHTYEYANGMLAKENYYSQFCTTPVDEIAYVYQNGKLDHTETTMRSFYSSITALCNPAAGIRSQDAFEYDGQGRLSKVTRSQAYTVYTYNAADRIVKYVIYDINGTPADSVALTYDSRGNIIREDNSNSGITQYEYDNKKNPLYRIGSRPDLVSAFTTSPNNVLRGTGAFSFQRNILLYQYDMPLKVEENGAYYTYMYQ